MEMKKKGIKRLINLEEKDGKKNTITRLHKRYKYLESKNHKPNDSNQMKYIKFHLRKLERKAA
jgi:hypothetical protein